MTLNRNYENINKHINKYIINIYDRYTDLKQSNKQEYDNNDLWKIFEYYINFIYK